MPRGPFDALHDNRAVCVDKNGVAGAVHGNFKNGVPEGLVIQHQFPNRMSNPRFNVHAPSEFNTAGKLPFPSASRASKLVGSLNPVLIWAKAFHWSPMDLDTPRRGRTWVVLNGKVACIKCCPLRPTDAL